LSPPPYRRNEVPVHTEAKLYLPFGSPAAETTVHCTPSNLSRPGPISVPLLQSLRPPNVKMLVGDAAAEWAQRCWLRAGSEDHVSVAGSYRPPLVRPAAPSVPPNVTYCPPSAAAWCRLRGTGALMVEIGCQAGRHREPPHVLPFTHA
jgi:hypothetical protein